ncbi:MAG TPA: tetratricopeptide repeat protein [Pyrinomonadaceae bacterium]|nr:tetratricopeptide repeat protein [Pyrinomonadaceae bacterium]
MSKSQLLFSGRARIFLFTPVLILLALSAPVRAWAQDESQQQQRAFSFNRAAEAAMREGEAAFAHNDMDAALKAYQRALELDPTIYEAPLFIGDVYFQKHDMKKAGEWYAKAVALNPNRETAYRYWSDALLRSGEMEESLDKAIEAIIAEPYNNISYRGLIQWAQANHVQAGHPQIDAAIEEALNRSNNLREAVEALRARATTTSAPSKQGATDEMQNSSTDTIAKLNDAGMLEAFVLLAHANEGIKRDYEEYRKNNREKLRRYLREFVVKRSRQEV